MDLASLAFAQAWQLTALILMVLVVVRLCARQRPHLAYMLSLLVLIKCVTPPLWSSPAGVFSWLEGLAIATSVMQPPATSLTIRRTSTPVEAWSRKPSLVEYSGTAIGSVPVPSNRPRISLLFVVMSVWLLGLIVSVGLAAWRCGRFLWRIRQPAAAVGEDWSALLQRLCGRLRVRRPVRLRVTAMPIGPAVVGLFRPTVLLPEAILHGKRTADLEPILAHELIHIRRGDLWFGLLQVAAEAIWWFHPLVWWTTRLASREAERCCDEEVVAELKCDPRHYARSLLEVLELKHRLQPVPVFPGMKPVEITSQRMERIMKLGQGCHRRTPWWCWIVFFAASAVVLPGAAWVWGGDEPVVQEVPAPLPERLPPGEWPDQAIILEMQFLTTSQKAVDAAVKEWEVAPMELHEEEQVHPQLILPNPGSPPAPERRTSSRGTFGASLETQFPAIYTIVDDNEAKRALERLKRERRATVLSAPKVATVDQQTATVQIATQRPFVVSLKEGQPQIRVVTEGLVAHLHPTLQENGQLRLSYELIQSEIRNVKEQTLRVTQRKEPVTLQLPEVFTSKIGSSVEIPSGKTLLVRGLYGNDGKGKSQSLLVAIRAQYVTPSNGPRNPLSGAKIDSDAGLTGAIHFHDPLPRPVVPVGHHDNVVSKTPAATSGTPTKIAPAVVRSYGVADLLQSDLQPFAPAGFEFNANHFDLLVKRITSTIEPESWIDAGGAGAIEVFQTNSSLVISHVPEVHERVVSCLNDMRKKLGLPLEPTPTVTAPRRPSSQSRITKTYAVADLVVPIPSAIGKPLPGHDSPTAIADFETLTDLITHTIAPDSWNQIDGANIQVFPSNLSLVIHQTSEVHNQISDLLEQLRRLQDIQVSLETQVVGFPSGFFERSGIDLEFYPEDSMQSEHAAQTVQPWALMSDIEKSSLLRSAGDELHSNSTHLPKVTLFNGQAAGISLEYGIADQGKTLQFQTVVSADHKAVQLKLLVASDKSFDAIPVKPILIDDGQTLCVDVSGILEPVIPSSTNEPSLLRNVPYVSRLFKNPERPKFDTILLLVTPRVIVSGESPGS